MPALKAQWQSLRARYQRLARRERGLVAAAALLTPALLANSLWVEPRLQRTRSLEGMIGKQKQTLDEAQGNLQSLQAQLQTDPDAPARGRQKALQEELQRLDRELLHAGRALVRPQEMNALLEQLLFSQPGLRLLSLNTLAPSGLLVQAPEGRKPEAGADKAEAGDAVASRFNVYRHGVEIRLAGNYLDLLGYLADLEAVPERLLWEGVNLTVDAYPRSVLTLRVYTLSLDKAWLVL